MREATGARQDLRRYDAELSGILPGTQYDADTQCRQQYGAVAKHCKTFKVIIIKIHCTHSI